MNAPDSLDMRALLRSVLVFRALKLGDMLCAVPALRALRNALPDARITLIGLTWARSFATRFAHYIDNFLDFPGYPGLPEQDFRPGELARLLGRLKQLRYDLAIQMHGSGAVSNALVASFGARFNAGFHPPGARPSGPGWFTSYPENVSEVERNLMLVRSLGFPAVDSRLEFPILAQDEEELAAFESFHALRPRQYVCVHPGASIREKCWPVEGFAEVGRFIRRRGPRVVITGNAKESDLAAGLSLLIGNGCIDAASSDLSIAALALLIRDARLLICNDTGVSHLASAFRVPSVVIFSHADPERWAPSDRNLHISLGGNGRMPAREEVVKAVTMLFEREDFQQWSRER